jgi:hypothetical protein
MPSFRFSPFIEPGLEFQSFWQYWDECSKYELIIGAVAYPHSENRV